MRPHIFERFWQAEETARKGRGLGLYIAKGLVEAQGGAIWVDSQDRRGTTFFSFTLPLAPAAGARQPAEPPSPLSRFYLIPWAAAQAPRAGHPETGPRPRRRSGSLPREEGGRFAVSRGKRRERLASHPGLGGGGGGGGGGPGAAPDVGGGSVGVPGGGTSGGGGIAVGGSTHDERSKNRNSSALACGDIALALQPVGNGLRRVRVVAAGAVRATA